MISAKKIGETLLKFWGGKGCEHITPYDLEVGAATLHPETFKRCLIGENLKSIYIQKCRRPGDGRYGKPSNRLYIYRQVQVIMHPYPPNMRELFLKSLKKIGFNNKKHCISFRDDDWKNTAVGAYGTGREICINGLEIAQFTYLKKLAGKNLKNTYCEIAYGLERLSSCLQGKIVSDIFDNKEEEKEWSIYNFKKASTTMWEKHFNDFITEAQKQLQNRLPDPAYDLLLKALTAYNHLKARVVVEDATKKLYEEKLQKTAEELTRFWGCFSSDYSLT